MLKALSSLFAWLLALLALLVALILGFAFLMLIIEGATKIAISVFGAPLDIGDKITSFVLITTVFGFIAYMQYKDPSYLRECDCKSCKDCKEHKKEEFSILPFFVILVIY
ncbi:MAG: hypothetical protein K0Q53_2936, partial [Massilibacillus sp.]|nr:hypothetical protein [Massilibacillus sp.]